jgi:polyketide biosynthesis acyl carrier protein
VRTEEILVIIVDCCREVLPRLKSHAFEATDRLADLGADSVDRAEVVTMVLERLSLTMPRTELFGARNVGELAELLARRCSA